MRHAGDQLADGRETIGLHEPHAHLAFVRHVAPDEQNARRIGFGESAHRHRDVGVTGRFNSLGSRTFTDLADALTFSSDTALVTSLFQAGRTFDAEKEVFGHKPVSYETDASVSGGTENTKYYVSALVKDDGGIATNTGYKKQSLRSNIDQELGSGFQLAVNLSGMHSLSRRGLTNNDNSGHQPVPGVPVHAELRGPAADGQADGFADSVGFSASTRSSGAIRCRRSSS